MPGDSLFSRTDGDDEVPHAHPPADANEGVRIIAKEDAAQAAERSDAAKRKTDEPKFGDRPAPPPPGVTPALSFPLDDDTQAEQIERPRPVPVLDVSPATGEHQLQHWTEPATGKVPKVVIGDAEVDDDQAWSAYAAGGPRWRDDRRSGDQAEGFAELADLDETSREGALDTGDRMTQEEFLGLDDVEMPSAAAPRAPSRGSANDPIRIGSDPRRSAAGTATATRSGPVGGVAGPRPDRTGGGPTGGPGGPSGGGGEARPTPPRDIQQALVVGLAIVGVAVLCFKLGQLPTTLLATAILVVAAGELYAASRRHRFTPITPIGLVAVAGLVIGASAKGEPAIPLVLFLTVMVMFVWYIVGASKDTPLRTMAMTFFGVAYVGVLGSFAGLILHIGPVVNNGELIDLEQGVSILFLAAAAAVAYDVAGLFLGRQFGKTKLTSVSPNKTVEGLAGGMAAAVIAVLLFGTVIGPFTLVQDLFLGLMCAFAAPIGDLAESLIKRDLGIKDMGDILPGHGGVLDRFDGLLFVLPIAYYTTRVLLTVG